MLKVEEPIWNRSSLGCHAAPIKNGSSISPISVNDIHRAEHHWVHWLSSLQNYFYACNVLYENKTWCFFSARKAIDACREVVATFVLHIRIIQSVLMTMAAISSDAAHHAQHGMLRASPDAFGCPCRASVCGISPHLLPWSSMLRVDQWPTKHKF